MFPASRGHGNLMVSRKPLNPIGKRVFPGMCGYLPKPKHTLSKENTIAKPVPNKHFPRGGSADRIQEL